MVIWFRKGHSCETQLTTDINDWAKILDNGGQVDTFILDFENTPHELLKSKLFCCGIGGKTLKWIDSFLCYRQQRVVVNGAKSDWAPVLSGVPQGTVLGPLLFSFYINDISTDIDSEIRLFADDCGCYREIKDTEDTLKLQKDIDQLECWARKWGMRFQPVKCNIMQITKKRVKKFHASYTLEGTNLKASSIWGSESQMICDGIHMSAIFALRLIGPLASWDEIFTLVHKRLKRQHIKEWCAQSWNIVLLFGTPSGVGLKNELEKVQNWAARFVTGNYNFETGSMTGILEHLKWEFRKKRRRDSRLILLYKALKGKASIPTDDFIPLVWRCRNNHSMAYQVTIANIDIYTCSPPPTPHRPLGIGMHFQTLLSPLLKVPMMVLLSSLLWWELGTSLPGHGHGPGEWLSFWRVTSKFWFWFWL